MKILVRIIILLLIISLNVSVSAQDKRDSIIQSNIDSLLISGVDTVIIFQNSIGGTIPIINELDIKLLGGLIHDSIYVIYFKGQQWTFVKYAFLFQENLVNTIILKSKPLNIQQDSALFLLRKKLQYISTEQFLPYIFEYLHNGVKGYSVEYTNHFPSYRITISARGYNDSKYIEGQTLYKNFPSFGNMNVDIPENLNFKYNTSLNLFVFFTLAKNYIEKVDGKLRLQK